MAINERNNDVVEFRIVSRIGVLAEYQTGWTKELNIVIWNGGNPKYDLRDWNQEHDRMTRGITLHEEEARKLCELLTVRFAKDASPDVEGNVCGSDREHSQGIRNNEITKDKSDVQPA